MKKYLMLLFITISTQVSFSQSKFSEGFSDGYKKGYCHNQGIGCLSPLPPIAPIPKIGESLNSYQDGYNRGFEQGLNTQKQNPNTTPQTRERFKARDPKFVDDFVYKPNYDLMLKVIEQRQQYLNDTYEIRQESFYDNVKNAYQSYFQKDYHRVIQYCRSALNTKFYNSEVYFLLGVAYYHAGEYDLALNHLNRAKSLGEDNDEIYAYISSTKYQLRLLKEQELEDYKNLVKRKPLIFGVKGGLNYSKTLTSPMLGVFFQGSRSNNFAMVAELHYFQIKENEIFWYRDSDGIDIYEGGEKTHNFQFNWTFKSRLTKRVEFLYGIGTSFGDILFFTLEANGGVQYHLSHKIFLDGRFNYRLVNGVNIFDYHNASENLPKSNIMISLGYQF